MGWGDSSSPTILDLWEGGRILSSPGGVFQLDRSVGSAPRVPARPAPGCRNGRTAIHDELGRSRMIFAQNAKRISAENVPEGENCPLNNPKTRVDYKHRLPPGHQTAITVQPRLNLAGPPAGASRPVTTNRISEPTAPEAVRSRPRGADKPRRRGPAVRRVGPPACRELLTADRRLGSPSLPLPVRARLALAVDLVECPQ
jgi:hypothetical protein